MQVMLPWSERPVEVANLFNPAFCALLLRRTIDAYHHSVKNGMDFPLAFIVLPIVLHKATREVLPTISTKLNVWMQRHHEMRIGFAERTQNLVPITREGLMFALQQGALQLDETGALIPGAVKLEKHSVDAASETAICLKKAEFIGRWFAEAGNAVTILTAWGIKVI